MSFFRVCSANDIVFQDNTAWTVRTGMFVSACRSLVAAKTMLQKAPNPFADRIVQLTVTGGSFGMVYDDQCGKRKLCEEEVIVPLVAVDCVQLLPDNMY